MLKLSHLNNYKTHRKWIAVQDVKVGLVLLLDQTAQFALQLCCQVALRVRLQGAALALMLSNTLPAAT